MSIFKKLERVFRPVLKAAAPALKMVPGVGAVVTAAEGISMARRALSPSRAVAAVSPSSAVQAVTQGYGAPMSLLPALGSLGRGAVTAGRAVVPAAGRVLRNPGVQGAAGAVVGGMLYDQFGNPVRRAKRRAKGITARELKSFTRVTSILNKYCKTPPPMKRRTARSKSCR